MGSTSGDLSGPGVPPQRRRRIRPGATARRLSPLGAAGCLLAITPVLIPAVIWHYVTTLILCLGIRRSWGQRRALVVYSDSPAWKHHFEAEILPRLQEHAIVLNWSERRHWSNSSLAVRAYRHFGKGRQPLAIVFRPLFSPRSFDYRASYKAFKRGDPAAVQSLDRDLFATLGI